MSFETKTCPKCGREYMCPPALSRMDNETEICPVCGVAEAIEPLTSLTSLSSISEEARTQMLADIEKTEIENGRVKPLNSSKEKN